MNVGDKIISEQSNWNFGGDVPKVFVEHIRKSVPYYDDGHDLICSLSDFFCHKDSICYELGCSTGQLLKKLSIYNNHKPTISWIGIDCEEKMVQTANEYCSGRENIVITHDNILTYDYENADMIIAYYCVQFIPERQRQELFNKIYQKLNWGGAFILFEKVRAPDARFQDMMTAIYTDYKLSTGFSSDEIIGKAKSLKGVLDPFSTKGNMGLLERAGFVDIMTVMKYVCFEGFLAIK